MPDEKDETLEVIDPADALEMIDLGDAVAETTQLSPLGNYWDCMYFQGRYPGC